MHGFPIAIYSTGLVTAVGLSAPASCAAIRARISNPTETHFIDSAGEPIMAHQVALEQPWRGRSKLTRMAAMAIDECLADVPRSDWPAVPLLLCVAETARRGRLDGLDDSLFCDIQDELGVTFAPASSIFAQGRVSAAVALLRARELLYQGSAGRVLITATDSLLNWPTVSHYERSDRVLTDDNSNGFMPGEGAGALLVGKPGTPPQFVCKGIGFGAEPAHIGSGLPLRADGMTQAFKRALAGAGCAMHDVDFRITDVSGEQYFFKEASLALSRVLRVSKEKFDLWHPAECTGATGAAAGIICLAVGQMAGLKGYARGSGVIVHLGTDEAQRAAMVCAFG